MFDQNRLGFFSFSSDSLGVCLGPLSPIASVLLQLFAPLIFLVQLWASCLVHFGVATLLSKMNESSLLHYIRGFRVDNYIRTSGAVLFLCRFLTLSWLRAVAIYLFSFTSVISTALNFLYCVDVGGARVVWQWPAISCAGSDYTRAAVPVVLALIIYVVVVPAVFISLLVRVQTYPRDFRRC